MQLHKRIDGLDRNLGRTRLNSIDFMSGYDYIFYAA